MRIDTNPARALILDNLDYRNKEHFSCLENGKLSITSMGMNRRG